jgi:hypothetical protein
MTTPYEITYATDAGQVRVAVVDRVGQVDGLAPFLPARWATRHFDSLYAVASFDLMVLGGATPELVAAARLLHPDGSIIAVIDADAPVEPLVGVLQAGADACVRSGSPAVLAGHLLASHRRRVREGRADRNRARSLPPAYRSRRPPSGP